MARINGVDIPDNKRIVISLTYIFGIGNTSSNKILKTVNIDVNRKTKDLSEEELNLIRTEINNFLTEGDLRRTISMNIKRKMEIGCYEGMRHRKKLPVRGQRTSRNARTWKNKHGKRKVVANKKK